MNDKKRTLVNHDFLSKKITNNDLLGILDEILISCVFTAKIIFVNKYEIR